MVRSRPIPMPNHGLDAVARTDAAINGRVRLKADRI